MCKNNFVFFIIIYIDMKKQQEDFVSSCCNYINMFGELLRQM